MEEEKKSTAVKKTASPAKKPSASKAKPAEGAKASVKKETADKKPASPKEVKASPEVEVKPIELVEPILSVNEEPLKVEEPAEALKVVEEVKKIEEPIPAALKAKPLEEVVTPEVKKPQKIVEQKPVVEPVVYLPLDYSDAVLSGPVTPKIETFRKGGSDSLRGYNTLSKILLFLTVAVVAACFIVAIFGGDKLMWLTYTLTAVAIIVCVGAFIYTKFGGKKRTNLVNDYFNNIFKLIAIETTSGCDLKDVTFSINGRNIDNEVINAHLFTTINRINSRCHLVTTLNSRPLTACDVAVVLPKNAGASSARNERYGIYGRYFIYELALANQEALVIIRKSANTVLPNHLSGYHEVVINGLHESFSVYATTDDVANNILKEEVVATLNSIVPTKALFDFIISLNEHGSFFALNYSDDYMVTPLVKPVSPEIFDLVKADNEKVIQFFKLLK